MVRKLRLRGHVLRLYQMRPSTSEKSPSICPSCRNLYNDGNRRETVFLCCRYEECLECVLQRTRFLCPTFRAKKKRLGEVAVNWRERFKEAMEDETEEVITEGQVETKEGEVPVVPVTMETGEDAVAIDLQEGVPMPVETEVHEIPEEVSISLESEETDVLEASEPEVVESERIPVWLDLEKATVAHEDNMEKLEADKDLLFKEMLEVLANSEEVLNERKHCSEAEEILEANQAQPLSPGEKSSDSGYEDEEAICENSKLAKELEQVLEENSEASLEEVFLPAALAVQVEETEIQKTAATAALEMETEHQSSPKKTSQLISTSPVLASVDRWIPAHHQNPVIPLKRLKQPEIVQKKQRKSKLSQMLDQPRRSGRLRMVTNSKL